ncbi:MAG: aquaporin [SAR202 cluster bacterium]|nr:aquaporin [SAR202 cluster bacterium]
MPITKKHPLIIQALSEATGTFILVEAAAGSVMLVDLHRPIASSWLPAVIAGFAVAMVVYLCGPISGAHINPAVTMGMILDRRTTLAEGVIYWLAQTLAAVAASIMLKTTLGSVSELGGHSPSESIAQAVAMEIFLTFMLMTVIIVVVNNQDRFHYISGIAIGSTVCFGILIGSPISGGSMNPARSFGPAAVSWSWAHHWVYWVGPVTGAIMATVNWHLIKSLLIFIKTRWSDHNGKQNPS